MIGVMRSETRAPTGVKGRGQNGQRFLAARDSGQERQTAATSPLSTMYRCEAMTPERISVDQVRARTTRTCGLAEPCVRGEGTGAGAGPAVREPRVARLPADRSSLSTHAPIQYTVPA